MVRSHYDVLVIGAGWAGLTAAVALARSGTSVAVVEANEAPGWGSDAPDVCCVETLAKADVLGPEATAKLPWDCHLAERGGLLTDGMRLLGLTYRDPVAFAAYRIGRAGVVLPALAAVARQQGATLHLGVRTEGLIKEGPRVIGAFTSAGPVYADLVFLAEGDAGLLLAREGLERSADPRDAPRFLLELQVPLVLPPEQMQRRVHLSSGKGTSWELLVHQPTEPGSEPRLSLWCRLVTGSDSVALSVMAPLERIRKAKAGPPGRLLADLLAMPVLGQWLAAAVPRPAAARIRRVGGPRDVPRLAADGLAVGGAAAGLGLLLPAFDFVGPAATSGLLLARAVSRIRSRRESFSRQALEQHYVEALQQTSLWQDLELLRRWPGHLRRAHGGPGEGIDLVLGTAHVLSRPHRWAPGKASAWLRLLARAGGWRALVRLREKLFVLGWALQARRWAGRPALGRLLLDGSLNALRDLAGKARPNLPPAGQLDFHYHSCASEGDGRSPRVLRRWLERFGPVLGAAVGTVLRPNKAALRERLGIAARLVARQLNLLDLVVVIIVGALALSLASIGAGWLALRSRMARRRRARHRFTDGERPVLDSPPSRSREREHDISFVPSSSQVPHVFLLWPRSLPDDTRLASERLSDICPTEVFEFGSGPGQTTVATVHPVRCVACHACWRLSRLVDWGYVALPFEEQFAAARRAATALSYSPTGLSTQATARAAELLDCLEGKLRGFEEALARCPATVDRASADHLEMLARYTQQVAVELAEALASAPEDTSRLARDLASRASERSRLCWDGHFIAAVAAGRALAAHHVARLRHALSDHTPSEKPRSRREHAASPLAEMAVDLGGLLRQRAPTAMAQLLGARIEAIALLLDSPDTGAPIGLTPAEGALRSALVSAVKAEAVASLARELAGVEVPWDVRGLRNRFVCDAQSLRVTTAPAQAIRKYAARLADGLEKARIVLGVNGRVAGLMQRQALLVEWEELRRSEGRLEAVFADLIGPSPERASELTEAFARQEARMLALKLALLGLHDRLEAQPDAEREIGLVRVLIDELAGGIEALARRVPDRGQGKREARTRPVVEPEAPPLPGTVSEYLAGAEPYREGDFLIRAVDLCRPRLTPEACAGQPVRTGPFESILTTSRALCDQATGARADGGRHAPPSATTRLQRVKEAYFVVEALVYDAAGRALHPQSVPTPFEDDCVRLVVTTLTWRQSDLVLDMSGEAVDVPVNEDTSAVQQRLTARLLDHLTAGGPRPPSPRHLAPEALDLEAAKTDFRHAWAVTNEVWARTDRKEKGPWVLGLALAQAAAWLWAAECVLGRLAWISQRLAEATHDEALLPDEGLHGLGTCLRRARNQLQRLNEDLAGLRRGSWPPVVRAVRLAQSLPIRQVP